MGLVEKEILKMGGGGWIDDFWWVFEGIKNISGGVFFLKKSFNKY